MALHMLRKCCALISQRLEILGSHYLDYNDLALLHWRALLTFAKASGLRIARIMQGLSAGLKPSSQRRNKKAQLTQRERATAVHV